MGVDIRPATGATALQGALVRAVAQQRPRLVRRALSAARKARLRISDPPVAYRLDGTDVVLPLSHLLPVYRAVHPDYSRNLGRIVAAVAALHQDTTVIDIGANVGDSAAIIRAHTDVPILCVEGDELFLPYLRHNVRHLRDVEIAAQYVATSAAAQVVERTGGTARLVAATASPGATTDQIDATTSTATLDDLLEAHPSFAHPAVVKVDTDGHDAVILHAATDLLRRCRPVLFFEHDPEMARAVGAAAPTSIFRHLAGLGYDHFLVYDNKGPLLHHHSDAEIDALEALSEALDPRSDLPYVDVCAVATDPALVSRLLAG